MATGKECILGLKDQRRPVWGRTFSGTPPPLFILGIPNSPDLGEDPLILGSLAYSVQTFPGPHPALPCSTKQMLADLIQFHPGDSLEEILTSSAPRERVSSQDSPQQLSL